MTYKAVPATGKVNSAAPIDTPAQRALESAKHLLINCQQASRNRKMEVHCQMNNPASRGRWLSLTDAAMKLGNSVRCACDSKNCELTGNRSGCRIFTTPGR